MGRRIAGEPVRIITVSLETIKIVKGLPALQIREPAGEPAA